MTFVPTSSATGISQKTEVEVIIGAIVGGVAGGLAVISILTLIFFCRRRLRNKNNRDNDVIYSPLVPENGTWNQTSDEHRGTFAFGIETATPITLESENVGQEQSLLTPEYVNSLPASRSLRATAPSTIIPKTKAGIRQTEIMRRMQEVQQEMADLERGSPSSHLHVELDNNDDLRMAMEQMRVEIGRLKDAQYSRWGQGLSDELPPVYAEARHKGIANHATLL